MQGLIIHTDGGCSGNPGPGAWAFLIEDGSSRYARSAACARTTNNRMELSAVIEALREVRRRPEWSGCPLEVFTDSRYVEQGITSWIRKWQRNGWKTAAGKPVKNRELWTRLDEASAGLSLRWHWLEGHAGSAGNEECHRMVQEAIRSLRL